MEGNIVKKSLFIVIIILLIVYMYYGIENVQKSNDEENFNVLNEAIRRNSVLCYAIEGFYPPNIEYLENNYGLLVDHEKYIISYSVFASNIMPEFTVFIK